MRISHSGKKLLVITAGDPSGIGPEIILKSLARLAPSEEFIPLVIGDLGVFKKNARVLKINILSPERQDKNVSSISDETINFIDLNNVPPEKFRFGVKTKLYGKASMEYLKLGISIATSAKGASLVTAPINKASINMAGYRFAGHTEFLSHATGVKDATMMLIGGPLRVSLVTRHLALKDVAKSITRQKIEKTISDTYYALKRFFRIKNPRIGVAALNPHAGESGVFGTEEKSLIAPAVNHLKKKIKGISGPLPADTLFYKAYKKELDAVVSMYHDQGLIPLKMIAFVTGVNLTIGLPFIRTSPDHGTGFDIAGKGEADPSSMIATIKLAAKLEC